jgi:hypothetical protein
MFLQMCWTSKDPAVVLQAFSNHVDEWPLRITLEEMFPNLQDAYTKSVQVFQVRATVTVVKVDNGIGFFHDAAHPMQDAVLAVCRILQLILYCHIQSS